MAPHGCKSSVTVWNRDHRRRVVWPKHYFSFEGDLPILLLGTKPKHSLSFCGECRLGRSDENDELNPTPTFWFSFSCIAF